MMKSSDRAKDMCKKLGKPSQANARVLASLFPACASSAKKRKFDPTDECVVAEQHRRKKSASAKGRSKQVTVVLMKDIPSSIPKGAAREQLKKKGQVKDIAFQRHLDEDEVKELLSENFEALKDAEVQYLQSHKNNSLSIAKVQNLDGIGVISLAGSGSLYLRLSPKNESKSPMTPSTSSSGISTDSVKKTLDQANDILEKLRVSIIITMFPMGYF